MGNVSEYKTFNGQIGKRPIDKFLLQSPTTGMGTMTNPSDPRSTRRGSTENTFIRMQH